MQHLAETAPVRRLAVLTAVALELGETLTDLALDIFDRLFGSLFRRAERRHADAFLREGRAVTEKVRLYARIGAALTAAKASGANVFAAIEQEISWERFVATVAEAAELVPSEDFDSLDQLDAQYTTIRRWAPTFLSVFEFKAAPTAEPLLRAIGILRDLNAAGRRPLPPEVPLDFVGHRWRHYVVTDDGVDRRYWELAFASTPTSPASTRARTAWQRRCATSGAWNAHFSPWTGWNIPPCVAAPMTN